MTKTCLPDVNVWLALTFQQHEHHGPAVSWFEAQSGLGDFCRATQVAFLRLATTPQVFGVETLTMDEAWQKKV
jgi:predicted nucleic acid-binding protein